MNAEIKYLRVILILLIGFCTAVANGQTTYLSTATALEKYGKGLKNKSFLAYPVLREDPIKWFDSIPEVKIIDAAHLKRFSMRAQPEEIYVYQIGLWAFKGDLNSVSIEFSDLRAKKGNVIAAGKMSCYNKGGIDFKGGSFIQTVRVSAGRVQALWMGVDLAGVKTGTYAGSVSVVANGDKQTIPILLNVNGAAVLNHGYNDSYRLSRLNWLDATTGINDKITKGFDPVGVEGKTISILGRTLTIAESGLPASIVSFFGPSNQSLIKKGEPIIDRPFRFVVEEDNGDTIRLIPGKLSFTERTPSKVCWKVINSSKDLDLECTGQMEFDGFVDYHLTLKAKKKLRIKNISLALEMDKNKATYMMGLNKPGGLRPDN